MTRFSRALRSTAVLLLAAAPSTPADAQTPHAPEPVTLLTVPDTTRGRNPPYLQSLTRDAAGRVYLAARGAPPAVLPLDGGPGTYLRTTSGNQALGGDFSWIGDTLAVGGFDTWQLFGPGGAPRECRAFEQMHNEFATQVFPLAPLADGLAVGELAPPYPDPDHPEALVVSRGQAVIRTLHRRPSGPYRVDVPFPWGGGASSVVVPFTAETLWKVSDNGAHVVVVEAAQPAGPGPHPVRALRMDTEGRVAYDVRLSVEPRPVSRAERDGWMEEAARSMSSGTIRRDTQAAREAFREHVRIPDYHPAVTVVLAAGDGSAWLRLPDEDGAAAWMRLDARGSADLRLRVPAAFRAVYADADALWGGLRERDGTLRVVAYPLPGRPPLVPADFTGRQLPDERPPLPAVIRGRC